MRGSIFDTISLLLAVVLLIMCTFIGAVIWSNFKVGWQGAVNATNDTHPAWSESEQQIMDGGDIAGQTYINLIPISLLFVGIGSLVLAYFIPSSPIFMPIGILALVIFVFISTVFSNALDQFMSASEFLAISNANPILGQIVRNLPTITAIFGGLLLLVMYSRGSTQEGNV